MWLWPGLGLPSQREPVVLWLPSCLGLGFASFSFAGGQFLGLFGARLVLGVFVHKGFAARECGSLRETTLRELPLV